MNIPVYVDTNVIMDFILERHSSASAFFEKVWKCKYRIITSPLVCEELRHQNISAEVFVRICAAYDKLRIVEMTEEDKKTARQLLETYLTHYSDALHKTLAEKAGARHIITRNVKDFVCFQDISIRTPDET